MLLDKYPKKTPSYGGGRRKAKEMEDKNQVEIKQLYIVCFTIRAVELAALLLLNWNPGKCLIFSAIKGFSFF